MSTNAWIATAVVVIALAMLVRTRLPPYLVLLAGMVVLLTTGVLTPAEAVAGFASEGMLTVAALYIVVAGLRETGAMSGAVQGIFGRTRSVAAAQLRMMLPVMVISAFINNTPVVAAFIPLVTDWARKFRISTSKLMLPLSYAAILGGTCTLIGTSTNLIVNGLLIEDATERGLAFFEIAWVGLPVAIVGLVYVVVFARWLLPERIAPIGELSDPREYTVEMIVTDDGSLAGRTVEEAGLRHLPGLYLVEIQRDGHVLAAVGPDAVLDRHDRLVFAGITESVADLLKIRGLAPATDQVFKLDTPRADRRLVEAIVAPNSPIANRTVRASGFRARYGAVVIAVGRDGERVQGKVGDIVLRAGDMLLVEGARGFVRAHQNSRDFLLVRALSDPPVPRRERALAAWMIVAAMVAVVTAGLMPMLNAAFLAAGAMILFRCVRGRDAMRSVDLEVLLVIVGAIALGEALSTSGAAAAMAGSLLAVAGRQPWLLLAAVYAITALLTESITNNAAAVLVYPLAGAAAGAAGLALLPFAVTIMMAASASFATPIGYQTNLMVYGPGGYRFGDYLRFGLPLNVVAGITTVLIVPRVWPL
ncbi:MAG TPA: SLC13 family permease [Gammaproteobacteria bacterium]|nr:SLC13 family permease [Gammaproteobacteria bacterium]